MKRGGNRGLLYILPGFAGLCVFYIIPFVISLGYVFGRGNGETGRIGTENFKDLLGNPAFQLAAKNTLVFTLLAVPLLTLGALFLAMVLGQKQSPLVQSALFTPMILPVASALLGWQGIFGPGGLLGKGVEALGGTGENYLEDPWAWYVLLFLFFIKNLGYMTLIFTGAIGNMKKEYREAFLLDSDSLVKYTFQVAVPILAPILFFVMVLSTVNCFQIFREVSGLYGDYPPESLYMLQNFMNNNFEKLNYSRLCTASFLLTMGVALLVSLYLWAQHRSEKGESGL